MFLLATQRWHPEQKFILQKEIVIYLIEVHLIKNLKIKGQINI